VFSALAFAVIAISCAGLPQFLAENHDKIVAIDVALQPARPSSIGRRRPSRTSRSFRRFVRASDVHSLAAAVANVLATTNLGQLNLKATGYRSGTWNGISGTALALDLTPELRRLEERIVEATRMFAVDPESAESFIVTPDGSRMNEQTIDSIEEFVPESSGANFRPHVTASSMPQASAKPLESNRFEPLTFKPAGALVYQLGPSGAPQRILWTWTGESGARHP
jgi:hypothetical protein